MEINVFRKIRQATVNDGTNDVRFYSIADVCSVIGYKGKDVRTGGFTRRKKVPMPRVMVNATDWFGVKLFLSLRRLGKAAEMLEMMNQHEEEDAPKYRQRKKREKKEPSTDIALAQPVTREQPSEMSTMMANMFDGCEIRTAIKEDGTVWFVLMDVCRALGIVNSRDVSSRLRDKYKGDVGIADVTGRIQSLTIVSEAGLYSVIMESRSPKAEDFQDWVLEVVLPSIRQRGSYVPQKQMSNVELAKMVIEEAAEKEKYAAFARMESTRAKLADEKLIEIKRHVDALQPMAEEAAWLRAADELADELLTPTEATKILECKVKVRDLKQRLVEWRWVDEEKKWATTLAISKNWMRMVEWEANGMTGRTAKITKSGMKEIEARLRNSALELSQKTLFEERKKKGGNT